jgi:hypothetical protein
VMPASLYFAVDSISTGITDPGYNVLLNIV